MRFAFVLMTSLVLVTHLLFLSLRTHHFCLYFQYAFNGITNGLQRQPRHYTVQTFIKYVRLLPRWGISSSSTFIQLFYNEMPTFQPFDTSTPCPQCTKEVNLVLCGNVLVRFPDGSPTQIETYRNIKCDIITYIDMEQFWTFCWLRVMN